jgi:hypothetical protein
MKNIFLLLLTLLLLFTPLLNAQTEEERMKLLQISREADERWKTGRAEAESLAVILDIPIRFTTPEGVTFELQRFENGFPQYYVTDNSTSGKTISTFRTYINEIGGFSLSGMGQTLGIWDAGAVLHGHQEFGGRTIQMDGAGTPHQHATHVAGTMVAGGVNPIAKGMSHRANLNCYDWNNDYSELSNAAANGLRVSNHSYGTPAGWVSNYRNDGKWAWLGDVNISPTEDYKFGHYNSNSVNWDNLLYSAPNLFVTKSAGNERGDGPVPGTEHWVIINGAWTLSNEGRQRDGGTNGYDCVGDGRGVAKNVFSVGAVAGITGGYSSPQGVQMSSFSSWGPTDDGRIKPDVVANGLNVTSTNNTGISQYINLQGTSMSSPSVAGSVGILLQHQAALHGANPLRGATLKALIIHTADECGPDEGPDYKFGWGLMNTLNAVKKMSLNAEVGNSLIIKELTLNQGTTYEKQFQSNGTEPLKVTISWTDPAGSVSPAILNWPGIKLVNDLDLRIVGPGGNYLPWVLDPANPSAAATTGDNIRDNTEQIFIPFPAAGSYTITVSHKGTLQSGSQNFSMIVTGQVLDTPDEPLLLQPDNGTQNLETKPFFKWQLAPKGFNYQLQVALDSTFSNIVVDTVIAGIFVQLSKNLPELNDLFWRVRGVNSGGPGVWSQVWNFSTKLAIPDPPVLVYPESGAMNIKNNTDFVWSTESTVETYRTQVSTNVLFTALVFSDSTISDTTVKITNLTENRKYFWRTRGKNSSGSGDYSAINNFTSAINPPDSLTAELLTTRSVQLDWKDKSAVENRYYILRKNSPQGDFEMIDSLAANSVTYTDTGLAYSTAYSYRVFCAVNQAYSDSVEVSIDTPSSAGGETDNMPVAFSVMQNYPNPFNPLTVIKYGIPAASNVKVNVYNTLGEIVGQLVNTMQAAGYYEVKWDAGKMSSGIYFYSIEASSADGKQNNREVRKMLLLK